MSEPARRKPKITVTTVGKPPLTAAAAFARLLFEKVNQRPELRVVEGLKGKAGGRSA